MPYSSSATTDLFSADVKVDGTYVFGKGETTARTVELYPGTLVRAATALTWNDKSFRAGEYASTWPPSFFIREGGRVVFGAAKTTARWSGTTWIDIAGRRGTGDSRIYSAALWEAGSGSYLEHDAAGFGRANWDVYIAGDYPSDIELHGVASRGGASLLTKLGFPGLSSAVNGLPFEDEGGEGAATVLRFQTGTVYDRLLDSVFRYLLGLASASFRNGELAVSPGTWTGALSDYKPRPVAVGRSTVAVAATSVTVPGSTTLVDFVLCNRFTRAAGLIGRIDPGTYVLQNNVFGLYTDRINLSAVSTDDRNARGNVRGHFRYPPLYSDVSVTFSGKQSHENPNPGTDGKIEMFNRDSTTLATPVHLSRGPARYPVAYREFYYTFLASEGAGARDYSGAWTFEVDPLDSDIYRSTPAQRTVTVHVNEQGTPQIRVSSPVVTMVASQREAKVAVSLSDVPSGRVTVTVAAAANAAALGWTHEPQSFTFTPSDWQTLQDFTATAGAPRTGGAAEIDSVEYTFSTGGSGPAEYRNKTAVVTFQRDYSLPGTTPAHGAKLAPIPGSRTAVVSDGDAASAAAVGKYYVEELELDLIADTVMVTLRQESYLDPELDGYLELEATDGS